MKHIIKICCVIMCCVCSMAHGYSLHVGDKSFVLGPKKTTSPALAASINGTTFYGTLHSGNAPDKTLHTQYDDNNYWLGQNCDTGMYSETGVSACTDCTIGHYCPGGARHVPCTYGAISCKTKNLTTEGALPDGAPINNFMTLDQVNEFIPITDSSDWQKLSCCYVHGSATVADLETLNDPTNACATGTIGPGTYLFVAHYTKPNSIDSISGITGSLSNAFIAIFDHTVSYASIHGNNIFQHFIDTEHSTYTEWTLSTAPISNIKYDAWQVNKNETNILNLVDLSPNNNYHLCVYELK